MELTLQSLGIKTKIKFINSSYSSDGHRATLDIEQKNIRQGPGECCCKKVNSIEMVSF